MFERMKATDSFSNNPVGEVVGKNFKTFLIAVGLKLSEVSWVYMLTVFVVVYATTKLALPKQLLLDSVMYAALFELITLPMFGWLSDKIGRRPFFILGAIFTIAFAFPLFWMLETKSVAMVTIGHHHRDELRPRHDVRTGVRPISPNCSVRACAIAALRSGSRSRRRLAAASRRSSQRRSSGTSAERQASRS